MDRRSLKTKVTVALVVSIAILDGVGFLVAHENFRDTEVAFSKEQAAARVESSVTVLEVRLQELINAMSVAVEEIEGRPLEDILLDLHLAGFSVVLLTGPDGLEIVDGSVDDAALVERLRSATPSAYGRVILPSPGGLLMGARAYDMEHGLAALLPEEFLSHHLLGSTIAHTNPLALVAPGGFVLGAIDTPADASPMGSEHPPDVLIDPDGGEHFAIAHRIISFDGKLVELVPVAAIEARAADLAYRFFLISTVVYGLSGAVTIFIVARSLRPLEQITREARRLREGADRLDLDIRSGDEMQVLADTLQESAGHIAASRKRDRLAAEHFELAVGGLSRAVGEADSMAAIGARLADAVIRVTPATATFVHVGGEIAGAAFRHDGERALYEALFASRPELFLDVRADDLRVDVAPESDHPLEAGDVRKIEILAAQAALALHRARVTEGIRKARDDLDRSLRHKEMVLDVLSHDLKNPLAAALVRLELLARRDPELKEKLAPAEQSIERATRIIEETLLWSKLEKDDRIERRPSDVAALARDAVEALQPLAATRGVALCVVADGAVEWAVHPMLCRAIENVLSNAIKWSPRDACVEVVVDVHEDRCRVRIVDHGPGIPAPDRARLFARFQRVDRSGVKGTGLGLAIAKRVVEAHGGDITIDDTPGGGATFTLALARPPPPAPGTTEPLAPVSPSTSRGGAAE